MPWERSRPRTCRCILFAVKTAPTRGEVRFGAQGFMSAPAAGEPCMVLNRASEEGRRCCGSGLDRERAGAFSSRSRPLPRGDACGSGRKRSCRHRLAGEPRMVLNRASEEARRCCGSGLDRERAGAFSSWPRPLPRVEECGSGRKDSCRHPLAGERCMVMNRALEEGRRCCGSGLDRERACPLSSRSRPRPRGEACGSGRKGSCRHRLGGEPRESLLQAAIGS